MIPERVETITSATFSKNKNKIFNTPLGIFEYRYINKSVYPYGIVKVDESNNSFLIATKEKAICDILSKIRSVESLKKLSFLLYEDLRIDKKTILKLNKKDIYFFSTIYYQHNIKLLNALLEKEVYIE